MFDRIPSEKSATKDCKCKSKEHSTNLCALYLQDACCYICRVGKMHHVKSGSTKLVLEFPKTVSKRKMLGIVLNVLSNRHSVHHFLIHFIILIASHHDFLLRFIQLHKIIGGSLCTKGVILHQCTMTPGVILH